MRVDKADFGYHINLNADDVIEDCFFRFAEEHKPPSSYIYGMGSIKDLKLGFYDSLTDQFIEKVVDDCLEMTSFMGNLTYQHDVPILHAHITAAFRDFSIIGGHFISGRINVTGEFAVYTDHLWIRRAIPKGRSIPLIQGDSN